MERTVVAMFDDLNTAQKALEELLNNGFDRNNVSVVRTNEKTLRSEGTMTDRDVTVTDTTDDVSGTAAGAGIGAVLGGMGGLLVGLGALAIPGIGPIVAAGPLAAALAGAGIGAATGGIIGALTDAGIPENEAGYYAEGIRRGGTLLSVRAKEDEVSRATQILNRYSPVDVDQRATEWRGSGWTGFDSKATSHSGMQSGRFEDFDNDFRSDWQTQYGSTGFGYERYQPAYRFGYESRGRHHDRNWNDVESDLRSDWQRNHPNEKWEDFKDSIQTGWERFKGGVRDLGQDAERGMDRMGDRMRDAGHDASRDMGYDRSTTGMGRSFDLYDRDFRSDWEQTYRSGGHGYERYQPAYQYGYSLANENRYRGRQWNDIESDARRDWETRQPGDRWEDFKDAVQHAWQRVRADVRDAID